MLDLVSGVREDGFRLFLRFAEHPRSLALEQLPPRLLIALQTLPLALELEPCRRMLFLDGGTRSDELDLELLSRLAAQAFGFHGRHLPSKRGGSATSGGKGPSAPSAAIAASVERRLAHSSSRNASSRSSSDISPSSRRRASCSIFSARRSAFFSSS